MTNPIKTRTALAAALAVVALAAVMLLPTTAAAQAGCTPTDYQYDKPTNVLCEEVEEIDAAGGAGDEAVNSGGGDGDGELPFTGFDALSLLAIAVALTGVGFTLRRLAGDGGERS